MNDRGRPGLEVHVDPGLAPECPHCSSSLSRVNAQEMDAVGPGPFRFGKRFAYACPRCNKLLAITHRKGFWMG